MLVCGDGTAIFDVGNDVAGYVALNNLELGCEQLLRPSSCIAQLSNFLSD